MSIVTKVSIGALVTLFAALALGWMAVALGLTPGSPSSAVTACAEAIDDQTLPLGVARGPGVDKACGRLSVAEQDEATAIASKRNGLVVYVPPYKREQGGAAPSNPLSSQSSGAK